MDNHHVTERQIVVRVDDCSGVVACACGWRSVVGPVDGPVAAHLGVRSAWSAHLDEHDLAALTSSD